LAANEQLTKLCKNTGKHVRLSIKSGGCQGFSKVWDTSDAINDDDIVTYLYTGCLIIDQDSMDVLNGATIDYRIDISGSYFVIDIVNASSACGCGKSFSM